jgi:hypothetical protein
VDDEFAADGVEFELLFLPFFDCFESAGVDLDVSVLDLDVSVADLDESFDADFPFFAAPSPPEFASLHFDTTLPLKEASIFVEESTFTEYSVVVSTFPAMKTR